MTSLEIATARCETAEAPLTTRVAGAETAIAPLATVTASLKTTAARQDKPAAGRFTLGANPIFAEEIPSHEASARNPPLSPNSELGRFTP